MKIQELQSLYGRLPQCGAIMGKLKEYKGPIHLSGLVASAAPLLFAGLFYALVKLATTRRYLELERNQRDDLLEQSKTALQAAGIAMPHQQVDVHIQQK